MVEIGSEVAGGFKRRNIGVERSEKAKKNRQGGW